MKRYRVNYPLLFGLVALVVVAAPSLYFLWRYQISRNADRLQTRAEEAMKEDDLLAALENMARYVALRPDDIDAQRAASKIALDAMNTRNATNEALITAYSVLQEGVAKTGDNEIRRRLIDVLPKFGYFSRAIVEIDELIRSGSKEQKLYTLKAQCLAAVRDLPAMEALIASAIGYDAKTDEFDLKKAAAPNEPMLYFLMAQDMKFRGEKPELADRVMEQLIIANPDSAEAYIYRQQYLMALSAEANLEAQRITDSAKSTGKSDEEAAEAAKEKTELAVELKREAYAALDRANVLDPKLDNVLFAMGERATVMYAEALQEGTSREEAAPLLDEAARYFAAGAKEYPDQSRFILRQAAVEAQREEYDKAIQVLERGLTIFKLPGANALPLYNLRIELLLQKNDFKGVEDAIAELRKYNDGDVKALANFNEGRLQLVNKQWAKAAKTLRLAKARLLRFGEIQANASFFQGVAHEQLGQYDLALEAYEWALSKNPNMDRALSAWTSLKTRYRGAGAPDDSVANSLEQRIEQELAKPTDEQEWTTIGKQIAAMVEERGLSEAAGEAIKAQVLLRRAEAATSLEAKEALFQQSRDVIKKAFTLDKTNIRVRILAIRLLQMEPGKGPTAALKLLDQMLTDPSVKDSPELRALRAELLVAQGDPDVRSQLAAVLEGIEDWPSNEQGAVYFAVGGRFAQIGAYEEAQAALAQAAERTPTSLPISKLMFDVALQRRDAVGIKQAQEQIKEILGSEDDPDYILSEVRRRMTLSSGAEGGEKELQAAEQMLDEALKRRPRWSELWVVKGQLELGLHQNVDAALKAFDMALETGPANTNALRIQIGLLADRGEFAKAAEKVKLIPAAAIPEVLGRVGATVLRGVGDLKGAYDAAAKVAESQPSSADTQIWFADHAVAAEKFPEAEKALRAAAEINPGEPMLWSKLIGLFAQTKQYDKLESVLREAHLALDEEYLPLLNARYYEMQGRWSAAEDIYLSAYKMRMDETEVLQRLAEFYLNWPVAQQGDPRRAAPYLNRLMRMGDEGKLQPGDPYVAWARRRAAALLAADGSFASAVKAEKLIDPLVNVDNPDPEDLRSLALVLTNRMDPDSRLRAIDVWERLRKSGQIRTGEILLLGQLLTGSGRLENAQQLLEDAISRNPDNIEIIRGYARLLIDQRDFVRARRQIAALERKGGMPGVVAELQLRLAARSGDKARTRELLTSMTPPLNLMTERDLESVRSIGQLANEIGDHEYALSMATEYAKRKPEGQLELARMMGRFGDAEESMTLLKRLFDDNLDDVLRAALEIYRARRAESGDKLDDAVSSFVRRAINDDPENAQRLVLQAEAYEIREEYDAAIDAYGALVQRDDLPGMVRATALNNFAYLLALKGEKTRLDDALKAVDESAELLGPISDILDTRAVVHMARDDFKSAAADMKKSIQIGPTPSKYYHLARALYYAGDKDGAIDAWRRGLEEGLDLKAISDLEHQQYEEFARTIESE
ncbi:MAG: tetratricopeptide repeat protein [Pirellulales bacterium]|nr:tetratricopeptide repeat protein [Pirellulales bacterium]